MKGSGIGYTYVTTNCKKSPKFHKGDWVINKNENGETLVIVEYDDDEVTFSGQVVASTNDTNSVGDYNKNWITRNFELFSGTFTLTTNK